jgi:transposase
MGLTISQIAQEVELNIKTVAHWIRSPVFRPRKASVRPSKLDAYKDTIRRLVEQHTYSARQVLTLLREQGYTGGYSILKEYIQIVRPVRKRAFFTLLYAPGECAQVDWGSAGELRVGQASRRLSFLSVVLCYSRLMYIEFTLSQRLEHFLCAMQNAFLFFGGVPKDVLSDNLKTAVLRHPVGGPPVFHERYLDFARHHGFTPKACGPCQPQAKGRVENGIGYVRKSLLNGLDITGLAATNLAARYWLDTVANVRIHGETRQTPLDRFQNEKPVLGPLNAHPYDLGIIENIRINSQFRARVDGNRYSVPAEYASCRLTMKRTPDHLWFYDQQKLVADHIRQYDCGQDYARPEHERALLLERRSMREHRLLQRFFQLSPKAETFYRQMEERCLNPRQQARQIVALSEIHPPELVARAVDDACELQVYRADYVANILEQQRRKLPEPGVLHLTRRQDLLELDLPFPDLETYFTKEPQ